MPETLVVCGDLIFITKINGTAKLLGAPVRVQPRIESVTGEEPADQVLVDLSSTSVTYDELVRVRGLFPPPKRVIAYGSHVEVERLSDARRAGCDVVMSRSQFVTRLPELLGQATS